MGGQTHGIKECPLSGITSYGRVWSKVPESKAYSVRPSVTGIGYFTLPYLVHAHASHVHACEWNPHAVTALRRNLELNNIDQRCTIHCGDNRQVSLVC